MIEHVREALDGVEGIADARAEYERAEQDLEQAERSYRAAIEALDPTEPAEVERLREFRAARDAAQERSDEVRANLSALSVTVTAGDWDALTLSERRDLIRAVIERVEVAPGRGSDRLTIIPRTEARSVAA